MFLRMRGELMQLIKSSYDTTRSHSRQDIICSVRIDASHKVLSEKIAMLSDSEKAKAIAFYALHRRAFEAKQKQRIVDNAVRMSALLNDALADFRPTNPADLEILALNLEKCATKAMIAFHDQKAATAHQTIDLGDELLQALAQ